MLTQQKHGLRLRKPNIHHSESNINPQNPNPQCRSIPKPINPTQNPNQQSTQHKDSKKTEIEQTRKMKQLPEPKTLT